MRLFFEENDLLSGEIQQIHSDGGVNIQTRNLKYGKVNIYRLKISNKDIFLNILY